MNSKMTEKEFREKIAARLKDFASSNEDDAVEVAREAGLKFAPEPVKLPKTLELDPRGFLQPFGTGLYGWDTEEVRAAAYAVARDRYNNYPDIYTAADALCSLVRSHLSPATQSYVESEVRTLEVRLVKGPKP